MTQILLRETMHCLFFLVDRTYADHVGVCNCLDECIRFFAGTECLNSHMLMLSTMGLLLDCRCAVKGSAQRYKLLCGNHHLYSYDFAFEKEHVVSRSQTITALRT